MDTAKPHVVSAVHRTIQVGDSVEELELFGHDGKVTGILRVSAPGHATQVFRIEGDVRDGHLTKRPLNPSTTAEVKATKKATKKPAKKPAKTPSELKAGKKNKK